jgi:hypothetical protein
MIKILTLPFSKQASTWIFFDSHETEILCSEGFYSILLLFLINVYVTYVICLKMEFVSFLNSVGPQTGTVSYSSVGHLCRQEWAEQMV